MDDIEPIALYHQFPAGSASNQVIHFTDETALRNNRGGALLIDEITFTSDSNSGRFDSRVMLELGNTRLTNTYVPMPGFARAIDRYTEGARGIWTWKLRKPLYVPRGQVLKPTILNVAGTTRAQIVYRGTALPRNAPEPQRVPIPWVTTWITPGIDENEDTESGAADLVNPHDDPVFLDWLCLGSEEDDGGNGGYNDQQLTATFLRLRDSAGQPLIRDTVPIGHVGGVDRTWDLKAVMPSRSFAIAHITADSTAYSEVIYSVALVGHRYVNVADLLRGG